MKKLGLLVMPLMAISFLVSCGGSTPSPTPTEDVKFSAATSVTLDDTKTKANISLDWTPTEHSVECSGFTFTLTNQSDIKSTIVPGEPGSRPLNLAITFDKALSKDDTGDLKFHYNDKTAKKEGEGKVTGINVKLPTEFIKMPLNFKCLSDSATLNVLINDAANGEILLEYSYDCNKWTNVEFTQPIGDMLYCDFSLKKDDTIYFHGDNQTIADLGLSFRGGEMEDEKTKKDGDLSVNGNIMSLLQKNDFETLTTLPTGGFSKIFKGSSDIVDASNLILSATTLSDDCYYRMFYKCSYLEKAPSVLPATTLAPSCYNSMFDSCTSLTSAPELLATTLAPSCYEEMFMDCSNLTSAPSLPVTTLANNCYYCMFMDCSNLTSAPSLPATTLVDGCYKYIFKGCSNLKYIEVGFGEGTNWPTTNCTSNWLKGVANNGTFVWNGSTDKEALKNAGLLDKHETEDDEINHIPSDWTVQNPAK